MGEPAYIIDAVIAATAQREAAADGSVDKFLSANTLPDLLRQFCLLCRVSEPLSRDDLHRIVQWQIAQIDILLNAQVNAILHHPRFQRLEATWRGLLYLVTEADGAEQVKIRVLDISWKQVARDLERAIEFDQSQLFRKIFKQEFGSPGGEPFGLLLGDYWIAHRPRPGKATDDIAALREMSSVAAAAFAPFIAGVEPALFGLDDFSGLARSLNLESIFAQSEYIKWNALREMPDTRFVGLTVPQILMRRPYRLDNLREDGFCFHEDVAGPDASRYLWGNACYAFGSVVIRSFNEYGWFANIRGCPDGISGGVVTGIPVDYFLTDHEGVAGKYTTDVLISDAEDKQLADFGFIPLCHSKDTEYAVFYSNQSLQKAVEYTNASATVNAQLSAMLQYILCTSRFAHYLKVIGRDKVGSFATPEECETFLHEWLLQYVTASDMGSYEMRAKYPLSEGRVEVREIPARPGSYSCVMHLKPHMQFDQMVSAVRLVTDIAQASL